MKSRRLWWIALGLAITAVVAGPPLWRWWTAPPPGSCPVCHRHEHKESLVRFQAAGGKAMEVCCLSCALTYSRQTGKPIAILSVTDHETGKPLAPDAATLVVGSDVSPCIHTTAQVGPERETYRVRWDRCLPSVLAFASRAAAEAFRAEHGGSLRTVREMLEEKK